MKRIHSIFALIIMILLAWSPAYSQEWAITYGGNGSEGASSIQEISGGYIVAGWTGSFGAGGNDVWVLKLHSNGTIAWQKTYGRSGYDWTYSIKQTADGGYVVAGSSWSYDEGKYDFWVLKLDDSGDISWQKTYGGSDDDHPMSIQQTVDAAGNPDGYIVAGYTSSFGAGSYDVWVLRLDTGGSVVWENVYGGSQYDTVSSIQQVFDENGLPDGYVMAGITDSFGVGDYDIWVLKLLSGGTISWQKTYGGLDDEGADSIRQTFDGGGTPNGYIVAGGAWADSESFGHVLWLNNDGSLVWQKGFGAWSFDTRYLVEQTDGGFIVAGGDDDASQSDIWVAKLDSDGDIAWQNAYGGNDQDSFGSLKPTADGGYIVAGCTTSFGMGSADF
ncbi:MAG: hypothetical protein JRF37_05945, partial [Deltaproteobacteria bacterium]|nr:hypothetical protein [Deltaproteobacteria bacterium]